MSLLQRAQDSVPPCTYGIDVPLSSLRENLERFEVRLDPEYQRGHVWTTKQQEKFVGALLQNHRSLPPIWLNWESPDTRPSEVVDGKQRITAGLAWLQGEIKAHCPCGIVMHYDDLDERDRRGLWMVTMRWNWVQLDRADVLQYYLSLNSGGTVHSEEELGRVRSMLDSLTQ